MYGPCRRMPPGPCGLNAQRTSTRTSTVSAIPLVPLSTVDTIVGRVLHQSICSISLAREYGHLARLCHTPIPDTSSTLVVYYCARRGYSSYCTCSLAWRLTWLGHDQQSYTRRPPRKILRGNPILVQYLPTRSYEGGKRFERFSTREGCCPRA